MKRKISLIVLTLALVACSGKFVNNSFKSLTISKQTYESSLQILGDLYKQGQLPEDVKEKAISLGRIYKATHNEAVAALLQYQQSGTEDDKQKYMELSIDVGKRLADLLAYIQPYVKGGI
jgi:hypothetical protein